MEDNHRFSNYSKALMDNGQSVPSYPFMKHLSSIHQLIAMPSVIRAHDPKVAYLLECVGYEQHLRPGIDFIRKNKVMCTNYLFQCIIVETIGKVTHLIELSKWLNLCEGGRSATLRLPTVDQSQLLVDYFHASMLSEEGILKRNNEWLHGQYKQDSSLQNPHDFENFLECVATNVGGFIKLICDDTTTEQSDVPTSRAHWIEELCSIFMDWCGCRELETTRFQCTQVLANMEEIVSCCPFGNIEGIILGHGSSVGRSILALKAEKVDNCLDQILQLIHALPDSELQVLCLHRTSDGLVRLKANDRVCNRVDAEHMLCKLYIIYERLKGGSRSTSLTPRIFFEHCHPIPGINFSRLQSISKDAVGSFRLMVEQGIWVFYDEYKESQPTK